MTLIKNENLYFSSNRLIINIAVGKLMRWVRCLSKYNPRSMLRFLFLTHIHISATLPSHWSIIPFLLFTIKANVVGRKSSSERVEAVSEEPAESRRLPGRIARSVFLLLFCFYFSSSSSMCFAQVTLARVCMRACTRCLILDRADPLVSTWAWTATYIESTRRKKTYEPWPAISFSL